MSLGKNHGASASGYGFQPGTLNGDTQRGSRIDGIFTAPGKISSECIFFDGIRIGGWPLFCHLSVPAPIGIAESLRSIQRNLTYAILVLKKHIGQQFLFPICPPVLGGKMAHQIKRKQKVAVQKNTCFTLDKLMG